MNGFDDYCEMFYFKVVFRFVFITQSFVLFLICQSWVT